MLARPHETNILEWRACPILACVCSRRNAALLQVYTLLLTAAACCADYVLFGAAGSDYEGGVYHGKVVFPPQYPFKPPAITMCTPNGRFAVNTRLCLSMSDFHPETWNPLWSVASILTGLQSFFYGEEPTSGSVSTTSQQRRLLAADSLAHCAASVVFCKVRVSVPRA